MRWKKWMYRLIPLCFVSSVIADVVTNSADSIAWGNIFTDFAGAMVFVLIGLMAIIDCKGFLDWLGGAQRYYLWVRFIGCVSLLGGLFALAYATENALAALGIVPNPYSP